MAARGNPARLTDRSHTTAVGRREARVAAALRRALAWLERHREFLLPDAALFWSLALDIGRRRAGAGQSGRGSPAELLGGERLNMRLSADYRRVVVRMHSLRSCLPLASGSGTWWRTDDPARRRATGDGHRRSAALPQSLSVDAALINRALAEAAAGRPTAFTARWLRDGVSSTGYTLSHKLLGLVLLAAAGGRPELARGARGVARRVLAELNREGLSAYVDLTAQRVACLALAGCSMSALRTGIEWLMQKQRREGDWDYFEAECDARETVARVFTGRSPLLRPPIWNEPRDPMLEACAISLVHRGHATAVASCALACFHARGQDSSEPAGTVPRGAGRRPRGG